MKQYSLNELLADANEHFSKLNVDTLFATGDGQYFINENRALLHATPNKLQVFALVKGDEPVAVDSEPAKLPAHEVDTHGEPVKQTDPEKETEPAQGTEPVKETEPAKATEPEKATAKKPAVKKAAPKKAAGK